MDDKYDTANSILLKSLLRRRVKPLFGWFLHCHLSTTTTDWNVFALIIVTTFHTSYFCFPFYKILGVGSTTDWRKTFTLLVQYGVHSFFCTRSIQTWPVEVAWLVNLSWKFVWKYFWFVYLILASGIWSEKKIQMNAFYGRSTPTTLLIIFDAFNAFFKIYL